MVGIFKCFQKLVIHLVLKSFWESLLKNLKLSLKLSSTIQPSNQCTEVLITFILVIPGLWMTQDQNTSRYIKIYPELDRSSPWLAELSLNDTCHSTAVIHWPRGYHEFKIEVWPTSIRHWTAFVIGKKAGKACKEQDKKEWEITALQKYFYTTNPTKCF